MAGTKAGAAKAKLTIAKNYGDISAFYAKIGRKGGQSGKGPDYKGGFAGSRDLAARAGAKGGAISKRGYKYLGDGKYEAKNEN